MAQEVIASSGFQPRPTPAEPLVAGSVARDASTLQQIVARLLAEPLWHASLGSKELFHSNMLAWIVTTFPEKAVSIFRPWLEAADGTPHLEVLREHRHLDLIVKIPGAAPLVVENKMFSMPDDAQLIRYADEAVLPLGGVAPTLLLLSLVDPGWPTEELRGADFVWRWASYSRLAELIEAEFSGGSTYAEDTVVHYAQMLRLIQEVMDLVLSKSRDEILSLPPDVESELVDRRLSRLAAKVRVTQASRAIQEVLNHDGLGDMRVTVGFSHDNGLLEAFAPRSNGDDVGWQYQEGQWRLAMRLRSSAGRTAEERKERERIAATNERWFDFGEYSNIVGPSRVPPRSAESSDGFNRFDPEFVYRYRLLPEASIDQLTRLAVAYARKALQFEFLPV